MYGHQKTFLCNCQIHPNMILVLATNTGLQLLRKHGQVLWVDTTFKLFENELNLTVILISALGLMMPVAWLGSESVGQSVRRLS